MHPIAVAQMELMMQDCQNVKPVNPHVSLVMDSTNVPLVKTQIKDQEHNVNAHPDIWMETMESVVLLKSLLKKKP